MNHTRQPQAVGTLYVVGTPIGNMEDVTLRALRVLREADLIAAEDTRRTRKLLSHYDIHTPATSYHEHNKRAKKPQLISRLKAGKDVALVSDAGMPGISDPGHDLIRAALEENIDVKLVPGPDSIIGALVVSGLPTVRFAFLGFPPRKSGERRRCLEDALSGEATSILFESPRRVVALLEAITSLAPAREVAVARELTKKFEQVVRGTARQVLDHFKENPPRGELVVVVEGAQEPPEAGEVSPRTAAQLVKALMREQGLAKKEAMRTAAQRLGVSRRQVYDAMLEEKTGE